MERIRIGNDIAISWALFENNGATHLINAGGASVSLNCGGYTYLVPSFSVQGNVVSFIFPAEDQVKTGKYKIVLTERNESGLVSSYDVRDAFVLVPENEMLNVGYTQQKNVEITSVITHAAIANIKTISIVESEEEGGDNVVTFVLTDGSQFHMTVKNGSKGDKGDKGDQGIQGEKGDKGDTGARGPAGIEEAEVTVDATTGTPAVQTSVVDGKLNMAFSGLKGEKGDKGEQGNSGFQGDFTDLEIVNGLEETTVGKALDATQGKALDSKISQLGQKVNQLENDVVVLNNIKEDFAQPGVIRSTGVIEIFTVSSNYKVQKLYLKGGLYYIRVCKAGTQRGCWKYSDNTYETPVSEIWGNEAKEGIMTLDEGYYAIAWEQSEVSQYSAYSPLLCANLNDYLTIRDATTQEEDDTNDFYADYSNNVLIYEDGTEIASPNDYQATDFIKVREGDIINVTTAGGAGALLLSGYTDKQQANFAISTFNVLGGFYGTKSITSLVPKGIKYIRVCHSSVIDSVSRAHIVRNSAALVCSIDELHKSVFSFPATSKRRAAIMFQMDCNENFYNANAIKYFRLLKDNGLKSTYLILPQHLSVQSRLQILDGLYAEGNEFGIHSDGQYDISDTSTLTESQVRNAFSTWLSQMKNKGYINNIGFVPLGANLKQSFYGIIDDFMVWALTDNLDYSIFNSNYALAECSLQTPPRTIKRLAIESLESQYTTEYDTLFVNRAKEVIDSTIENGGYLIFYGHTYKTTNGTTYTVREEVLKPIVEYVKTKIDAGLCVSGNTAECLEWYYSKRIGE